MLKILFGYRHYFNRKCPTSLHMICHTHLSSPKMFNIINIPAAPWCTTRCTQYFDTELLGILPWADINGNCNIFFETFYILSSTITRHLLGSRYCIGVAIVKHRLNTWMGAHVVVVLVCTKTQLYSITITYNYILTDKLLTGHGESPTDDFHWKKSIFNNQTSPEISFLGSLEDLIFFSVAVHRG